MDLREKFAKAGQEGVFKYFDGLDDESKKSLLAQLEQVDLDELDSLLKELFFKTDKA